MFLTQPHPSWLRPRLGSGWIPLLIGIVVLIGVAAGGYWLFLRSRQVPTVVVQRGTVVRAFYATGTVRPDFEYVLKSRAQGALVELKVREGQTVSKGQVLARVDDKQLRFEVERMTAELKEAQAQTGEDAPQRRELVARLNEARQQFEISDAELKRLQQLFEKSASSVTDIDNARRTHVQWANTTAALESQLGTWKIESTKKLAVAEANFRKAQADLADTEVRSPIDGLVLERYVELNEVVSINQKLLLIADPSDKLMKAAVDEEDVTRTQPSQRVVMQLYAFSEQLFEGKVREILPTADQANKTYEVKVAFDTPPEKLRVGMTAELNFIEEVREHALVVPSAAVLDGKVYRPVENGGGGYEPVTITVGVKSLERYEILTGLKEGDIIVADAKQVAPVKLPTQQAPEVPTRKGDSKVAVQ